MAARSSSLFVLPKPAGRFHHFVARSGARRPHQLTSLPVSSKGNNNADSDDSDGDLDEFLVRHLRISLDIGLLSVALTARRLSKS